MFAHYARKNSQKVSSIFTRMLPLLVATGTWFTTSCGFIKPSQDSENQSTASAEGSEKVGEIADSIKCIMPAPGWYKKLWLDINAPENNLGRALMTHYMGCSGKPFQLSEEDFKALPIQLVLKDSMSFYFSEYFFENYSNQNDAVAGELIETIDESIVVATHFGNTLGNFQLELNGKLVWANGLTGKLVPRFEGKVRAKDRYDFNPSESSIEDSWRGKDTELRVRIAHVGLPGKAFDVESNWMTFNFDFPRFSSDLIQESVNSEKSGYSAYGEQVQLVLMQELRSQRWEKASLLGKIGILTNTMKRLHQAVAQRD